MYRTIASHLRTFALAVVVTLAAASTDTAAGRALSFIGAALVDLYRMGSLALYAAVQAIPAAIPGPQSLLAHEPEGTAHQRTWLIPSNAHMARMDATSRPAIEPGWRMCPST